MSLNIYDVFPDPEIHKDIVCSLQIANTAKENEKIKLSKVKKKYALNHLHAS